MPLIPTELQPLVALLLLGLLFVAFLLERHPPDVTAAGAAALFVLLGLTPPDRVLEVFSNPAPITIAAMFVISGALVRTGLLDALAAIVIARAEARPLLALIVFLGVTLLASGIVNNTPVVLILIPVIIRLARSLGMAETRLLIPLSYAAVLGGTLTLIGSSTNILVAGVAAERGLAPFGIFEIAPVGLAVAAVGGVALAVLGPWLLPDRRARGEAGASETVFLTEIRLDEGFAGLGRPLAEAADLNRPGIRITALREGKRLRRSDLDSHVLAAGDLLVAQATTSEILTLRALPGLSVGLRRGTGARGREEDLVVAEAMVTPTHGSPRDTVSQLSVGYRYGLRVLGAHRQGHVAGPDLGSARLRPADKLLLEGTPEGFDRLAQGQELVSVTRPSGRAYRRRRAPLALLALLMVVGLAALEVAPIALLALGAVAAILLFRCIDNDEAWGSINAGILVLILAMLVVGIGLEETGTVTLIVDWLTPWLEGLPPIALLAALYALTSILTETVTNNAVAVVVTPIAVALGEATGVDPRALVVAVMMGASASFATPVGYQTNTLVYGAGDYRFTDFLKIGVPMNLIVGLAAVLVIPLVFPLTPG
ncbi:di/tricarboxylate transporter [Limimaricola variabilis]|uniref:Di/tricarboxylate transporter n=1 Tax=Limimaricola variabilis TaxID=1492771 RepID=A0ABR6HM89_9RHOB|nr:SLC13 family permease [Limimaricola variabilis]MBB3711560.1 di/tricarboxylate transporter [Limimaricola variabilis]